MVSARIKLVEPSNVSSAVEAMFCYNCKLMRPAANFYPSRIAWRRGCCTQCETAKSATKRKDPLIAKLHSLRALHGRVKMTRTEFASLLDERNIAHDKETIARVKVRKLIREDPLTRENTVISLREVNQGIR